MADKEKETFEKKIIKEESFAPKESKEDKIKKKDSPLEKNIKVDERNLNEKKLNQFLLSQNNYPTLNQVATEDEEPIKDANKLEKEALKAPAPKKKEDENEFGYGLDKGYSGEKDEDRKYGENKVDEVFDPTAQNQDIYSESKAIDYLTSKQSRLDIKDEKEKKRGWF